MRLKEFSFHNIYISTNIKLYAMGWFLQVLQLIPQERCRSKRIFETRVDQPKPNTNLLWALIHQGNKHKLFYGDPSLFHQFYLFHLNVENNKNGIVCERGDFKQQDFPNFKSLLRGICFKAASWNLNSIKFHLENLWKQCEYIAFYLGKHFTKYCSGCPNLSIRCAVGSFPGWLGIFGRNFPNFIFLKCKILSYWFGCSH